ncbi:heterokaryon incompatibility protein-domain-containing protein [Pyrenochaeta sp. MPI-SDFR-AT-0127]|nr:heterokaryon incompatibility protein-domain-containing protein [Pyrenochaeta sp. MPI-SDFR-AT-0127]
MRLLRLDSVNLKWVLEDFPGPKVPLYAILSHTWGRDNDEVKFEDIEDGQREYNDTSKPGYEKLRFCLERVEEDGLRYFWIDTCCIKKSDSTELQRSLASMFYWYQRAARCYVFLSDVSIYEATGDSESKWQRAFSKSRWFKRGWALQELLAPNSVIFYSKEKNLLGDKIELATTIEVITKIPDPALRGLDLSRFSKEERLSWAKDRSTTVPEDAAYSLIGIFDVELHMLYAEGDYNKRKNAALRMLHKAIAEKNVDAEQLEDVIRIGGASWTDLSTLSHEQLVRLDTDLDEYRKWLLDGFPKQYNDRIGNAASLKELSQAAGKRMMELLANYGVRYEDLSDLEANMQSWKEPWIRYRNKSATAQARVQALVENRWYWTNKNEDVFTGIVAYRTLEDLMIWRGIWKK